MQERQVVGTRLCEVELKLEATTLGDEERDALSMGRGRLLGQVARLEEALEFDDGQRTNAPQLRFMEQSIAALCAQLEAVTAERVAAVEAGVKELSSNADVIKEESWDGTDAPADSEMDSCRNPCIVM
jgi:hypothetical protein